MLVHSNVRIIWYSNSSDRIVLFGIRYSWIFPDRIIFGIRYSWISRNEYYSVFGIRKFPGTNNIRYSYSVKITIRGNSDKGFIIRFENEVEIIKSSWQLDEITFLANIGGFIGVGKEFLWLVIMTISSVGMFISYVKNRKWIWNWPDVLWSYNVWIRDI